FLIRHNIYAGNIQILDDTHPMNPNEATFRPGEKTAIQYASLPGKITLTTVAGSRGTNFDAIDVSIVAKPSLTRILQQKIDRLGRNGKLGVIFQIFCRDDVDKDLLDANGLEVALDLMAEREQEVDRRHIKKRKPLDDFKDK